MPPTTELAAQERAPALPTTDERKYPCVTGADGGLRFTPEAVGLHAFAASIDGTRCVVPVAVGPERRRWLLGLACVPLGVALLVALLRRASTRR